jgi:hypothetical protein
MIQPPASNNSYACRLTAAALFGAVEVCHV